jgi:hypothetical protein
MTINQALVTTTEILLVIVAPLMVLYLRGNWPSRATTLCLVSIPVLWYPVYAPLHELSHIAGAYLVGGSVTYVKLIPSFWLGEFAHAWITPAGISQDWQSFVITISPYVLDIISIILGIFLLKRCFSKNPFALGLVFMLLCLRPTFDFVCESIGLLSGYRGDLYFIEKAIGSFATWLFISAALGLALFSIKTVLKRHIGFPESFPVIPQ